MKRLAFIYRTHITFAHPVTEHSFTLRCLPKHTPVQTVLRAQLTLEPDVPWAAQQDGFGNQLQVGCCREGHGVFGYTAQGEVAVDLSRPHAAPCNPAFFCPSPFTVPDERIRDFFHQQCIGRTPEELMELVHQRMVYTPGVTGVHTTAAQAFALGQGVCQDEAHLLIALCRLAGIPARYVCGLFVGEGATHAWVEVWQEGVWRGLDPTRNQPVDEEYLVLSVGRDYGDCPVERGVFRGNTGQTQTVFMQVTPLSPLSPLS